MYGPADASATPIIYWFIIILIELIFLMPAYPGYPGEEAIKRVSVCLMFK